jgi:hypothetical protein
MARTSHFQGARGLRRDTSGMARASSVTGPLVMARKALSSAAAAWRKGSSGGHRQVLEARPPAARLTIIPLQ